MFNDHAMVKAHVIAVRVDESTKQRFRALASRQGVSESALLKRLLDVALLGTENGAVADGQAIAVAKDARLYVRVSPLDRRLLIERAGRRELRAATYVSLLIRAHLREAAPLPNAELAALKRSIAELAAIGRNLNQFVRTVQDGGPSPGFTVENAKTLIRVCEVLHERTKQLIAANAASWRGGEPRG
jgi:antitoxin (DNA-binding transcriptional repressor) of toxin-antitoxin stability system